MLIPTSFRIAVCYISAHFSAFTLEPTAEDRLIGAALCSVMLQWAAVSFHAMSCFVNWHLWVLITGRLFCRWLLEFDKHSPVALFCFECINIPHMIMLSTGKSCFYRHSNIMCMHLLENVHRGAYFGNWDAQYNSAFLQRKMIKLDAADLEISSWEAIVRGFFVFCFFSGLSFLSLWTWYLKNAVRESNWTEGWTG